MSRAFFITALVIIVILGLIVIATTVWNLIN